MAPTKTLFVPVLILVLVLLTVSSKLPLATSEQPEHHGSFEEVKAWDEEIRDDSDSHPPVFDEKDVVVLNRTNFADFVNNTKHVMVEFYAPWCGYCQTLAPEYAAAATELKEEGSDVVLAKVDATQEIELGDEFKIGSFPTIYLLSNGERQLYEGARTKDAIVSWLKKKMGVLVQNVTSTQEAQQILATKNKIVIAFVDSLTGSNNLVLKAVAEVEDELNFYQTTNPEVAKLFEIDPKVNRPALVLLKKEAVKLSIFGGNFSKSAIIDFVSTNKHPLVITFSRETIEVIFENPLNKQVLLFASVKESTKFLPSFEEAAMKFKDKLIFVFVDSENKDYGIAMVDHFGIAGNGASVVAYAGHSDGRKYLMTGDITFDNIKLFAKRFLADKLQPFYKSDPIPDSNDGDVKIVVGKNFEEIVLDESKDVLLQVYASWCPHCRALDLIYNELGKHMNEVDSITIAKMDGKRNEHPKAKAIEFPTILFFPAGKKSYDPIIFDEERTLVELHKFLKKHATISFEIEELEDNPANDEETSTTSDEL